MRSTVRIPQLWDGSPSSRPAGGRELVPKDVLHVGAVRLAEVPGEQGDQQADHGANFRATARVAVAFTRRRRRSSSAEST
jgi:hypothetical protein